MAVDCRNYLSLTSKRPSDKTIESVKSNGLKVPLPMLKSVPENSPEKILLIVSNLVIFKIIVGLSTIHLYTFPVILSLNVMSL